MTPLKHAIKRETMTSIRDRSKRRMLIVSLEQGDVIGLRPKGCRKTYYLSCKSAWYYAAKLEGERIRREKKGKTK